MLLDLRSNISYVTQLVAVNFGIGLEKLSKPFLVSILMDESVVARRFYKKYPITVLHKIILADLIELEMVDFNVILGMDWLHSCYASIDCRTRLVKFQFPY